MQQSEQPMGEVREHVRRAGPVADMTINLTIGTSSSMRLSPGAMEALGNPDRIILASTLTPRGTTIIVRPATSGQPNSYSIHRNKGKKSRGDQALSGHFGATAFLREIGLSYAERKTQLVGHKEGNQLLFPLEQPIMGAEHTPQKSPDASTSAAASARERPDVGLGASVSENPD